MKRFVIVFACFLGSLTFAGAPKGLSAKTSPLPVELRRIIDKYTGSKALKLDVEKTVRLAVLEKETTRTGRLFISNGKLRMEFEEPDKTLIVVDAKDIWLVNYPPKELGGSMQVGRTRRNSSRQPPVILDLLSRKLPDKDLNLISQHLDVGGKMAYELKPTRKIGELRKIKIICDLQKKNLLSVSYWDDLDNETTYRFLKTDWNPKIAGDLFSFKPPPGVKVTQY